jgi:hypothetical protein
MDPGAGWARRATRGAKALGSESEEVRARAIRIVAWQGDMKSLGTLRALQNTDTANADLIAWAIGKIASLHSVL